MRRHLIVTNGDVAAGLAREARLADDVLPWRDVLLEGPVPAGLTDDELAALRGIHLARVFPIAGRDARRELLDRDRRLGEGIGSERITLLFEPDVTDQLQLAQIIERLSRQAAHIADWSLAEAAGPILTMHDAQAALASSRPVTPAMLELGSRFFAAVRSPDPSAVARLADAPAATLPYLPQALDDFLGDLPAPGSGLSRQ